MGKYARDRILWIVCREIGHQTARILRKLFLKGAKGGGKGKGKDGRR